MLGKVAKEREGQREAREDFWRGGTQLQASGRADRAPLQGEGPLPWGKPTIR